MEKLALLAELTDVKSNAQRGQERRASFISARTCRSERWAPRLAWWRAVERVLQPRQGTPDGCRTR